MHEARLMLAHVLLNFDIELADPRGLGDWTEQKSRIVWEKQPLMCKLKSVGLE